MSTSTFSSRFSEAESADYGSVLAAEFAASSIDLSKFSSRFSEAESADYGSVLAAEFAASSIDLSKFGRRFSEAESAGYGSVLAAKFAGGETRELGAVARSPGKSSGCLALLVVTTATLFSSACALIN